MVSMWACLEKEMFPCSRSLQTRAGCRAVLPAGPTLSHSGLCRNMQIEAEMSIFNKQLKPVTGGYSVMCT